NLKSGVVKEERKYLPQIAAQHEDEYPQLQEGRNNPERVHRQLSGLHVWLLTLQRAAQNAPDLRGVILYPQSRVPQAKIFALKSGTRLLLVSGLEGCTRSPV